MSGGLNISLAGAPDLLAALENRRGAVLEAVAAGLFAGANNIMTEAKERAPVDTGALRNSGYVTLPETSGDVVSLEVGFGGPAAQYAVVQHERTELRHEVGEAKFLENAVNAQAGALPQLVITVARDALERGSAPSLSPVHPTTPQG